MVKVASKSLKDSFYNLRFERKFIYLEQHVDDIIETVVFGNRFCFKEIYHKRRVNSIYFDDNKHKFYTMNVSGDGLREKYRVRWYGNDFSMVSNPTFEVKKKFGEAGDKYSYKLDGLSFDLKNCSEDELSKLIKSKINEPKLLLKFSFIFPTLYNSYERRYFLSDCGRFRITIDYNMIFYNPNSCQFQTSERCLEDVILELKYNTEDDNEAREVSQEFRTRLSKNSKYVRGYEMFNF
jgi:hypothetical protein